MHQSFFLLFLHSLPGFNAVLWPWPLSCDTGRKPRTEWDLVTRDPMAFSASWGTKRLGCH